MEGNTTQVLSTLLTQVAALQAALSEQQTQIEGKLTTLFEQQEEHQEDMEDRFRAVEVLIEDLQLSTDTVAHFVTIKHK